jgi:23S rRNA pseudouridine2457 synthase
MQRGPHAPHRSGARVVLLNKPYGVLCQFSGDGSRPTLKAYVGVPDVYPAGRLDADSEGLVVLTADGVLQARISSPRHKLVKTYWVQVEGEPSATALATLRRGVDLGDFMTRPITAREIEEPAALWPRDPPIRVRRAIPTAWLELRLAEGRNRQVRRMTAAVGFPTLRLIRAEVGPWALGTLAPGQWREAAVEGAW